MKSAFIPSRGRLDGLQAGRAVAATMVAIYHANNFVLPMRLYEGRIAWTGFGMGYAGVEFFFVLSGFIMVHVHAREFNMPSRVGSYFRKRVLRIYPIYWIVLAGLLTLYLAMGAIAPAISRDPAAIIASFLLLPSPDRAILPVAWTLSHEVAFYLVFSIFFFSVRVGVVVLVAWSVGCLLFAIGGDDGFPTRFILSPYNILFLFGVLIASRGAAVSRQSALVALVLGVIGMLVVGMSEQFIGAWSLMMRTLAYGAAASLIIGALAQNWWPIPRAAVFLGDASYAIYLVHLPVMNVVALLLARTALPSHISPIAMLTLLVVTAVAGGAAVRVLIEVPLLSRLSRRKLALSSRAG